MEALLCAKLEAISRDAKFGNGLIPRIWLLLAGWDELSIFPIE
jgi:hypothetical protein